MLFLCIIHTKLLDIYVLNVYIHTLCIVVTKQKIKRTQISYWCSFVHIIVIDIQASLVYLKLSVFTTFIRKPVLFICTMYYIQFDTYIIKSTKVSIFPSSIINLINFQHFLCLRVMLWIRSIFSPVTGPLPVPVYLSCCPGWGLTITGHVIISLWARQPVWAATGLMAA